MRRLLLLLALGGCEAIWQGQPAAQDPCDEAQHVLRSCGASLALFEQTECVGPALFAADCVLHHSAACESLSEVSEGCARHITDALAGVDLPDDPADPACAAPAVIAPESLFAVDGAPHRAEGLTYCRCTERLDLDDDYCGPPAAQIATGDCTTPCLPPSTETP